MREIYREREREKRGGPGGKGRWRGEREGERGWSARELPTYTVSIGSCLQSPTES